jgi:hypothetical protein
MLLLLSFPLYNRNAGDEIRCWVALDVVCMEPTMKEREKNKIQ